MGFYLRYASFDVVGWDGYFYPYKFNIKNFEPITGRVHLPPPIHQNFEAHNFVICSFVARMYDYHPQAIPAPYNHSNIDSDEVLFYTEGDFMSRNHIDLMDFTFILAELFTDLILAQWKEALAKNSPKNMR